MGSLDISPPRAPRPSEKKGFFTRLFSKKESQTQMEPKGLTQSHPENEQFDLDEIRRKLDLSDPFDEAAAREKWQPTTATEHAPQEQLQEPAALSNTPLNYVQTDDVHERADSWLREELDRHKTEFDREFDHEWMVPPEMKSAGDAKRGEWEPQTQRRESIKEVPMENPTKPTESAVEELSDILPAKFNEEPQIEQPTEQLPMEESTEAVKREEVHHHAARELKEFHDENRTLEEKLKLLSATSDEELPPADHPWEREVEPGKEFVLRNGQRLKSLSELREALEFIDQETFFHHVNEHKNDFANWILHVFGDEQLAARIRKEKSRKGFLKALRQEVKEANREHKEGEQRLKMTLKTRKEKIAFAEQLAKKYEELHAALRQKAAAITADEQQLHDALNERIAAELTKRLKTERAELKRLRQEYEKAKGEYELQLRVTEKRAKEREARHKVREESLKLAEQALKSERQRLNEERERSSLMINEARAAQRELAELREEKKILAAEQARLREERRAFEEELRSFRRKQLSVAKLETELRAEREELAHRIEALNRRESEVEEFQSSYKPKKEELEKRQKEIADAERRAEERLKKVAKEEALLEEKRQERRKVAKFSDEAERHVEKRGVLERKLHLFTKKPTEEPTVPPPTMVRNLKIYEMIDKTRAALDKNEIGEARELYNRIRALFNKEDLTPSEKAALYRTIRELYDDINAASLR